MRALLGLIFLPLSTQAAPLAPPVTPACISSPFGWRHAVGPHAPAAFHNGVDLPAPAGALVHAAADGTIAIIKRQGLGGVTIHLHHADGSTTLYAHLGNLVPAIAEGRREVHAGDPLGHVARTGVTYVPADRPPRRYRTPTAPRGVWLCRCESCIGEVVACLTLCLGSLWGRSMPLRRLVVMVACLSGLVSQLHAEPPVQWVSVQSNPAFSDVAAQLQVLVDLKGHTRTNKLCVVGQRIGSHLQAQVYWPAEDRLILWIPSRDDAQAMVHSKRYLDLKRDVVAGEDVHGSTYLLTQAEVQRTIDACNEYGDTFTVEMSALAGTRG